MDETAVAAEASRVSVLVPSNAKRAPKKAGASLSHHMTIIMCIAADGTGLPRPTVILPLVTMPQLPDVVVDAFDWSGSDKGWITIKIWSEWILRTFIPHVEEKRKSMRLTAPQFGRALLFMDSHASRLDDYTMDQLHAHGILPYTIPAHTSHILQPLDCGVHYRLKNSLKSAVSDGSVDYLGGIDSYRGTILQAVIGAVHDAHNPNTVRNAFERSGLWPWHPERVTHDPTKVTPSMAVAPVPEKPTATQVISGKLVTGAMIRDHRQAVAARKEATALAKEERAKERQAKAFAKEERARERQAKRVDAGMRLTHRKRPRRQASDSELAAESSEDDEAVEPPEVVPPTPPECMQDQPTPSKRRLRRIPLHFADYE